MNATEEAVSSRHHSDNMHMNSEIVNAQNLHRLKQWGPNTKQGGGLEPTSLT